MDQSEELKQYVLSQKPEENPEIRPYYSKIGDFLSFCWAPENRFYTRRVDEFLTCYFSERTGKVVGCKIKGIRYLMEQTKEFMKNHRGRPTVKGITVVGRGLSQRPAEITEYEDVWENGQMVEIEDPDLQPA